MENLMIAKVLSDMHEQRDKLDAAIVALEGLYRVSGSVPAELEEKVALPQPSQLTGPATNVTLKRAVLDVMQPEVPYTARELVVRIRKEYGKKVLKQSVLAQLSALFIEGKLRRVDKGVYMKKVSS